MIHVTASAGDALTLRLGKRFNGQLVAWEDDAFRVLSPNPGLHDWLVRFEAVRGEIAALRVQEAPWAPDWYDDREDLGVFRRIS